MVPGADLRERLGFAFGVLTGEASTTAAPGTTWAGAGSSGVAVMAAVVECNGGRDIGRGSGKEEEDGGGGGGGGGLPAILRSSFKIFNVQ